jgi:hypothetical protein
MAEARRRKLACFQKTRTGVIKKTVSAITTTTYRYTYGNS